MLMQQQMVQQNQMLALLERLGIQKNQQEQALSQQMLMQQQMVQQNQMLALLERLGIQKKPTRAGVISANAYAATNGSTKPNVGFT